MHNTESILHSERCTDYYREDRGYVELLRCWEEYHQLSEMSGKTERVSLCGEEKHYPFNNSNW